MQANHIQLGPGILAAGLDLTAPGAQSTLRTLLTDGSAGKAVLLGYTLPGGTFRCVPDWCALEGSARPLSAANAEINRWTVTLSGSLIECSPRALSILMGSVRVYTQGDVTVLTPSAVWEETEPELICWAAQTSGGIMGIQLEGAVSLGGAVFTFREHRAGELSFRFTAQVEDEEGGAVCRVILPGGAP